MRIETERIGGTLFIQINGELDLHTSPMFKETVEEKLAQYDFIKHLVIDFTNVEFIDSSGLGVILGRFKHMTQRGGRLSAINVSAPLRKVFELSGLLRIMGIYDDRRQAMGN